MDTSTQAHTHNTHTHTRARARTQARTRARVCHFGTRQARARCLCGLNVTLPIKPVRSSNIASETTTMILTLCGLVVLPGLCNRHSAYLRRYPTHFRSIISSTQTQFSDVRKLFIRLGPLINSLQLNTLS